MVYLYCILAHLYEMVVVARVVACAQVALERIVPVPCGACPRRVCYFPLHGQLCRWFSFTVLMALSVVTLHSALTKHLDYIPMYGSVKPRFPVSNARYIAANFLLSVRVDVYLL